MAVTKTMQSTKLILTVETGVAPDGSLAYGQRPIRNINPELTDDNAYEAASALGTLQAYPVAAISRQDVSVLTRA